MTKQEQAFLNRVAVKMSAGMGMDEAMQAVISDDRRICSTVFNLPRETRREFAGVIAERVYEEANNDHS